ncbi:peptidoglycan-binding domain-containing protein [Roseospirillum parvum]|uniref:Putative peptidoglycan binding domain-containing protein n=1 Tax=Roseospirillum parvum TaxID=83401 RepID=A0A1G7V6L9_9PROT|nr:peptidoglycan-binding domain-containing protein [Roseospirillum parvum]SDG55367.1 Putative peptidoglycan binding domain-containing protein [Roseospirillum parvum]
MYPTSLRPPTKRRPLNLLAPGKSDWFELDAPVGATPASQRNQRQDTLKLEVGLANTGHLDFSRTKGPTSYWGQKEDKALRAFQQDNGLKVDGLANPGGPTVKTLENKIGPRLAPFSPPTPDDVDRHHTALTEPGHGHLVTEPPALDLEGLERILLPLPAEQAAANQRTVEALLGTVDDGDLPDWAAKGIADDPDSVPVWQDMFLRLNRHDPRRANLTAWALLDRLDRDLAVKLLGGPPPEKTPLGVLRHEAEPAQPLTLLRPDFDPGMVIQAPSTAAQMPEPRFLGRLMEGNPQNASGLSNDATQDRESQGSPKAENNRATPDTAENDWRDPERRRRARHGRKRHTSQEEKQQDTLDTLRKLKEMGEQHGLDVSSRLLDHYMNGDGSSVELDGDWVRQHPPVEEGIEKSLGHFRDWLGAKEGSRAEADSHYGQINDWIAQSEPGDTFTITGMKWEGGFQSGWGQITTDQHNAIGDGKVVGLGDLELKRQENRITVSGTVTQRYEDDYDFKKKGLLGEWFPQGVAVGDFHLSRGHIVALENAERVKVFEVTSTPWRYRVTGTLTVKDGEVAESRIRFEPQD